MTNASLTQENMNRDFSAQYYFMNCLNFQNCLIFKTDDSIVERMFISVALK